MEVRTDPNRILGSMPGFGLYQRTPTVRARVEGSDTPPIRRLLYCEDAPWMSNPLFGVLSWIVALFVLAKPSQEHIMPL